MRKRRATLYLIGAALLAPSLAFAAGGSELFSRTTLLLILLITLADGFGFLFERLGLPELVGEIFAGIVLGNLALLGIDSTISEQLRTSEFMRYASDLAVVMLLFLVGLETNVRDMIKVGRNATAVAIVGVVVPVLLGVGAGVFLGHGYLEGWFIGAMLAATSVGITAKLLGEKNLLHTPSARVILGAAVIDDVLGILLLAILASIAVSGDFSGPGLLQILAQALVFFVGAALIARFLLPGMVKITMLSKHSSFWVGSALVFMLSFAELASMAGLAPLIGGFVAGLMLDEIEFAVGKRLQIHRVEEMLKPLSDVALTIFFVAIGSQVRLETLFNLHSLVMVSTLLLVAVIAKSVAGYAVSGDGFDRRGIGFGMIPRGEVGLVFAAFAFSHQVFDAETYSELILVVLLTTIIGPILLAPRLKKFQDASESH